VLPVVVVTENLLTKSDVKSTVLGAGVEKGGGWSEEDDFGVMVISTRVSFPPDELSVMKLVESIDWVESHEIFDLPDELLGTAIPNPSENELNETMEDVGGPEVHATVPGPPAGQ
jgi:hypothetical protein